VHVRLILCRVNGPLQDRCNGTDLLISNRSLPVVHRISTSDARNRYAGGIDEGSTSEDILLDCEDIFFTSKSMASSCERQLHLFDFNSPHDSLLHRLWLNADKCNTSCASFAISCQVFLWAFQQHAGKTSPARWVLSCTQQQQDLQSLLIYVNGVKLLCCFNWLGFILHKLLAPISQRSNARREQRARHSGVSSPAKSLSKSFSDCADNWLSSPFIGASIRHYITKESNISRLSTGCSHHFFNDVSWSCFCFAIGFS
jgi:hypothetical protein